MKLILTSVVVRLFAAISLQAASDADVTIIKAKNAVIEENTTRTDAELKRLQGSWEGEGAGGKCSITITGTSLLYRAGTNWFKTTFMLPEGTDPRQLHATITDCSPPTNNSIGTVVFAIFKIEDGTLTLAEVDGSDKPPETFASASSRYIVKKVPPPRENTEPRKSK